MTVTLSKFLILIFVLGTIFIGAWFFKQPAPPSYYICKQAEGTN